ncbi:selT/selW/selH selenoprotein domain [Campylobacter hyointestinalis]|uniref:Rdx family protein n=1 Tax=Campylobacter hyointestinalis TaxID=198 RepID=UPI000726C973|nr:Rdx family protein [Campylobacter hyointestinalis]CUU88585.1 selT/selW/selH selenoprotein domain [Campylobacter hyointestinalis]
MQIKISYCNICPKITAESLSVEEEPKKTFPDAKVSREVGEKGSFVVNADGKVVYDYNSFERPRFPEKNEIVTAIKKRLQSLV